MGIINVNIIKQWQPCYEPTDALPADWSGTIVQFLQLPNIPLLDKVWACSRENYITKNNMLKLPLWLVTQIGVSDVFTAHLTDLTKGATHSDKQEFYKQICNLEAKQESSTKLKTQVLIKAFNPKVENACYNTVALCLEHNLIPEQAILQFLVDHYTMYEL